MPVRATIAPLPEPGHALLRVSELDAAPDGLTLSIQRQQGPDTHLADDGWRRTETWLMPDEVSRNGDVLEFHLGPEICDRLAGIATIRLRVKRTRHRRRRHDRRGLARDADLGRGRRLGHLRRHGAAAPHASRPHHRRARTAATAGDRARAAAAATATSRLARGARSDGRRAEALRRDATG